MKVELIGTSIPALLPSVNRSPGLHVSEIITSLCLAFGYFEPGGADDLSTTWGQLGFAMEQTIADRYAEHYPGRYVRPGEFQKDSIYLSPDLYDVDEDQPEELKLSWMTAKNEPGSPKLWRYEVQLKAYATVLECSTGVLNVTFVNGFYGADPESGRSFGPVNRRWRYSWSRSELAENWTMLKTEGKRMLREGYVPEGMR